jgi:hypothetical protein
MSDTVKVVARSKEPFWRKAGLAGAALSHVGPFCEFHDHSGPHAGQPALFAFAPAARLGGASPDEIAARFEEHAFRLVGGFVVLGLRFQGGVGPFVGPFGSQCPITAFDQRAEALLVARVAAHRMGVDA